MDGEDHTWNDVLKGHHASLGKGKPTAWPPRMGPDVAGELAESLHEVGQHLVVHPAIMSGLFWQQIAPASLCEVGLDVLIAPTAVAAGGTPTQAQVDTLLAVDLLLSMSL